jgi:acyl-CoA thioester hydrolase, YbgC/YbaW family
MRSDCTFFCPLRVRYGEVDQQGIVYNANYAIYTEFAFSEFLRSRGYSYKELVTEYESEVCLKKATFEYASSAFEDDMLEVGMRVIKIGNRSFTLTFEIYRQGKDDLIVAAEIVYVGYDKNSRSSRPITGLMRNLLNF